MRGRAAGELFLGGGNAESCLREMTPGSSQKNWNVRITSSRDAGSYVLRDLGARIKMLTHMNSEGYDNDIADDFIVASAGHNILRPVNVPTRS